MPIKTLDTQKRSVVIIGGDSVIGGQLSVECLKSGIAPLVSTRRQGKMNAGRFTLDLSDPRVGDRLPENDSPIIIVAAQTGYDACEHDPASEKVNIDAPVRLARSALAVRRRVVFVSTNSVFGGDLALCAEDDEVAPQTAYSKQKAEAERQLKALPGWSSYGSIARLTKVLSPDTPPIPSWRENLLRGRPIAPFSDLVFSPISLQYAARGLVRVAMSPHCGLFHFSGAADMTYAEFARLYADARHFGPKLVTPTNSAQAGVDLLYKPRCSALGMARTERLLETGPQDPDDVVKDLLQAEQGGGSPLQAQAR